MKYFISETEVLYNLIEVLQLIGKS